MKKTFSLALLLAGFALLSFQKHPVNLTSEPSVSGIRNPEFLKTNKKKAVDAIIILNSIAYFNNNMLLLSDAVGKYYYNIPDNQAMKTGGNINVNFNGYKYELPVHQDMSSALTGKTGNIMNLQWKLTGKLTKRSDSNGSESKGNLGEKNQDFDVFDIIGVELSLAPQGHLVTNIFHSSAFEKGNTREQAYGITGIIIGRYHLTVKFKNHFVYLHNQSESSGNKTVSISADCETAYPGSTNYNISFNMNVKPQ